MNISPYTYSKTMYPSFSSNIEISKINKKLIEYEKNDFISGIYYLDLLAKDKKQFIKDKINTYMLDKRFENYSSKLFADKKNDAPYKLAAIVKKLDASGKETIIKHKVPSLFEGMNIDSITKALDTLSYLIRDGYKSLKNESNQLLIDNKKIDLEYLGKGCNSIVFKLKDGKNPPVAMKTYINPEDINSLSIWGELAVYQDVQSENINNIPALFLANPICVKVEDKTKEYTEVFDVDEIKDFDGYKGGWTIVEYITKETPVKKGGISFNDWLTQNNIYHLDMSFDNFIGAYVTDLGGIDAEC